MRTPKENKNEKSIDEFECDDINYNNSAYIKKTKKRMLSPIQNSKNENINNEKYDNSYNNEKEIRKLFSIYNSKCMELYFPR